MIKSFKSEGTDDIYHGRMTREARKTIPQPLWGIAWRKLDMLNAAISLTDLKVPPANRLESLKGSFKGKCAIRVNDQYRLVFDFRNGDAYEVEIIDYH